MDQNETEVPVILHCEIGDHKEDIQVGLSWSFEDIRQEVILQIELASNIEFQMWIVDGNNAPVKVNRRNKKKFTATLVLPPKKLQLIPVL